jgi:replicative DNA helicase
MGKISREEFATSRALDRAQDLPLYIDDTPGLTIAACAPAPAASSASARSA